VAEAMWALDTDDQPCWSAPLIELRAERHADWEVRLFAS
jgi:urease accessory protein UreF